MTWLASLVAALLAGVAGLFLAGFLANACVSWYSVSSREGASGYFVIFTALGGGIAALIVGLTTARIVAAQFGPGFLREAGAALAVTAERGAMTSLEGSCRTAVGAHAMIADGQLRLTTEMLAPDGSAWMRVFTAWNQSLQEATGDNTGGRVSLPVSA